MTVGESGAPYLAGMAAAASGSDMIAEQVWDGRAPTGAACCPAGEGTRSATPLLWSHAGLLRLAWTIQAGGRWTCSGWWPTGTADGVDMSVRRPTRA